MGMGKLDCKVFSIVIFTISALLFAGTAQYATAGGGCLDLSVSDGDAFIEWTCEDLEDFIFHGVDYLSETEVHICLESADECNNEYLDGDIHFAMNFISGIANEAANTITLVYELNDVEVEIVYTLEQISAFVAQVTHDYTISLTDVEEGSMFDSIKFIHTTDADVDIDDDGSYPSETIEFDASTRTLVYTGESGIRYEVESQDDIDWVGICDQENGEEDECELYDPQVIAGHLSLPPGVDVPPGDFEDWGTGLEYDFDLAYDDVTEVTLQVIERIVIPSVSTPGDTYVVMGNCCDEDGEDGPQDGSLATANLDTGVLTQVGGDIANQVNEAGGLSGLAIDSFGRFYVTAVDGGFEADLARVDENGAVLNNIGQTSVDDTYDVKPRDLSFQPETDVLFGVGKVQEGGGGDNDLFTIDTSDASVEILGAIEGSVDNIRGIAFDPTDGTLYGVNCSLYTLSLTGSATLVTDLHRCYDGLGIDSLGQIFGTEEGFDSLHLIDPSDGSDITVAGAGLNPSDVDFIVTKEIAEVHCDTEFEWGFESWPELGYRDGGGECHITYTDGSEKFVEVLVYGEFGVDSEDFPLVDIEGTFHMALDEDEIDGIWITEEGLVDYAAVSEVFGDYLIDTTGTAESMGIFGDLSGCDVETTGEGVGLFSGEAERSVWIVCSITPTMTNDDAGGPYPRPHLGDGRYGGGHDDGFCMGLKCIDVRNNYFNHFPETNVNQGTTQTFSLLVSCQRGADTCIHASIGGALPDSTFYDTRWDASLDKNIMTGEWTLTVTNDYGEIGTVTGTVQEVGDTFIQVTFNIQFLIPGSVGTHEGEGDPHANNRHLHVTLWDNQRGMSNYIFNDGMFVEDIYTYPQAETLFEPALEYEPLCLNEDSKKRHTCAFDMVRDWTIKQAEEKLQEMYDQRGQDMDSYDESEQN